MQKFIFNKNAQPNGDREVHNASTGCSYMPLLQNQLDLGYHASCHGAVAHAKTYYLGRINGCFYCCRACHTS